MPSREARTVARYVHGFDSGIDSPAILGGKGASLARMQALGLPTPPGLTIGTDAWRVARRQDGKMPGQVASELAEGMLRLGDTLGRRFGDDADPLLVSVRSGAPVSMPGMMDTILNLGLTDAGRDAVAAWGGDAFADQLLRRMLSTYASVVRGIAKDDVEEAERAAGGGDAAVAAALKQLIADRSGSPVPTDAHQQLREAVEAVWRSWDSRRAKRYRRYAGISDDLGTAVTVQAMVFGTYDATSGTGVVFSRDPSTGTPEPFGDYLREAQGEDVVAGGHNTEPLDAMRSHAPDAYADLQRALPRLEVAYRDMCDVEFTVEQGRLWILQCRSGQRSGAAAVRIAVDMVDEGLIDVDEALDRIPASAMDQLQAPVIATGQPLDVIGRGVPAAPGAGVGVAAFDADRAQQLAADGRDVVLVRPETSPEDIAGMIAASGIVTAIGGRTSHAAVVARGIGRPAVCGVEQLQVDPPGRCARFGDRDVREGDPIAVDGAEGIVVAGEVRLVPAQPDPRGARVLAWCDERRRVPIAAAAPEGFVTMTGPDDAAGAQVLVDVDWDGPECAPLLERTVAAATEGGAGELAFRVPDRIAEGDLRLPTGPWTMVVAPDSMSWTARLLAARAPAP